MIDATASFDGNGSTAAMAMQRASSGPAVSVTVSAASSETLAAYEQFCRSAVFAPAQSGSWVRHWVGEVHPDSLIAMLNVDGRPVLALALEVVRSGPFRVARFMGDRHANGNFAAADPEWLGRVSCQAVRSLFDEIARLRPDIDVLALQRLLPELDGRANPLSALPNFPSPNLSLAVDLDGGFDGLLDRASGKRKRKKHRSQTRKFETAGSFRRLRATTPTEVHSLLDAFFGMKEFRFRRMGIPNAFGSADVRVFFHALFTDALREQEPSFVLHGLEVGGKLRAVTGSSLSGKRLICEFGAIAEDELAYASPGDFLFFENIKEACQQGFAVYDFSVGDEPYKRLWCDLETQHVDVLVPLTAKGRALSFVLHQNARAKAFVKNSPTIWKLTKMLRRKAAGKQTPSEDDS
ncbi:acetyltransferase [Mesorhizobium sp. Root554]|uniref:GNAT family N-acetyltransferase n=1 Tax=unclassified Mesorhizobium TaxID=325217 RepID=UPI0006FAB61F|nr:MULTISPECIES: GNAT family N-acetyltransferase [unclassified Mesorhizobium]KQZ13329.1 acetyltransferase [Mesorhizobium sp. Root1471]KQZ38311.1 acetyltransferase [Mesorhizobium sp. Root554]